MHDVIIVGGGPAGLSAALVLGRCRRRVLVCDAGNPRNAPSRRVGGFLTRDGVAPAELLRLAREELAPYAVEFRRTQVIDAAVCGAEGYATCFKITMSDGTRAAARKLLLATGVSDRLPAVENAAAFYGRGLHHCPYCDGWERQDLPLAAYGLGKPAVGLGLNLRTWSDDVTAVTDGQTLSGRDRDRAGRNGVKIRTEKVLRLEGDSATGAPAPREGKVHGAVGIGGAVLGEPGLEESGLRRIVFVTGEPLECRAMFFNTGQVQRSDLAKNLGCGFTKEGGVATDRRQRTCVGGLYFAGDACRDVQFVIVAAAEGATAATAINRDLQEEDRK